ncbi:MAG: 3-carboxy-cis,cis-muconate cycloisomerase [Naasia sp.]|nr:3-carboxy-cis,cis-muconate cycloisomerase [Naasia sp.]
MIQPAREGDTGMPDKKSPVLTVLIRAVTMQVPWAVAQLHDSAISEDERPDGSWHSEWVPLPTLLRLVGGAVDSRRVCRSTRRRWPRTRRRTAR